MANDFAYYHYTNDPDNWEYWLDESPEKTEYISLLELRRRLEAAKVLNLQIIPSNASYDGIAIGMVVEGDGGYTLGSGAHTVLYQFAWIGYKLTSSDGKVEPREDRYGRLAVRCRGELRYFYGENFLTNALDWTVVATNVLMQGQRFADEGIAGK